MSRTGKKAGICGQMPACQQNVSTSRLVRKLLGLGRRSGGSGSRGGFSSCRRLDFFVRLGNDRSRASGCGTASRHGTSRGGVAAGANASLAAVAGSLTGRSRLARSSGHLAAGVAARIATSSLVATGVAGRDLGAAVVASLRAALACVGVGRRHGHGRSHNAQTNQILHILSPVRK